MLGNFNEEAQFILLKSRSEMLELHHPYIGTEHLVLAILKTESELSKKLASYNLTYDIFKNEIYIATFSRYELKRNFHNFIMNVLKIKKKK